MSDYGGLIKFRLPTGRNLSVRGSVTHNPSPLSYEAVVNHDLSVDRTVKPEAFRFALSLKMRDTDGNPVDFAGLMALDKVDFTFLHDTERTDRTYSRASLLGDPQMDGMTGEVSGITGIAEGYLEVRR